MKPSGHLNPSEETGTGCPVTSKYGRTPPNKHGGVSRQQQQQILKFVFDSDYVYLQYEEISLKFIIGSVSLCCVCSHVVVFGLFVRLS